VLTAVKWDVDKVPDCTGMKCDVLPVPRYMKKEQAGGGWLLTYLGSRVLKSFLPGGEDEETSDDEDSGSEKDEEEEAEKDGEAREDAESGSLAPLLGCGKVDVGELAVEELAGAGRQRVEGLLQTLDKRLQPQAQALMKVLENPKVSDMLKENSMGAQKLKESLKNVAGLKSSCSDKKFQQAFEKFQAVLQQQQDTGKALAACVMRLADARFKAHTGYSSGELLGFLKISPKQMARDTRELEDIAKFLDKLQETVNKNNWDEVIDNFLCLYDMHQRLRGQRSRQVFSEIWKNEELRRSVGVGKAFQDVECRDMPPNFVLREVKNAVMVVKKNAVTWRQPLVSEMAAIELTKTRQANFFAFLISAISGFFMFVATFFSGLALDAVRADDMHVPLLSFFAQNSSAVHP